MKLGIGLYVKNSIEAVELYKEAFGLELGYHVKNPDGSYYHSELCKDGQEILSVVEQATNSMKEKIVQVSLELDSAEEVKRAYERLSEGGNIDLPIGPLPWSPCAASVIDRFGVWWYISSNSHYPPEDYDYWKDSKEE